MADLKPIIRLSTSHPYHLIFKVEFKGGIQFFLLNC